MKLLLIGQFSSDGKDLIERLEQIWESQGCDVWELFDFEHAVRVVSSKRDANNVLFEHAKAIEKGNIDAIVVMGQAVALKFQWYEGLLGSQLRKPPSIFTWASVGRCVGVETRLQSTVSWYSAVVVPHPSDRAWWNVQENKRTVLTFFRSLL